MKMHELKTGQYFKLKDINTLGNEHLYQYYNKFYKYKDDYLFTAIKCDVKDETNISGKWYLVDAVQCPILNKEAFKSSEILLEIINNNQFKAYQNVWKFGTPFITVINEDILDHLDLQFDLRDYEIIEKEDFYGYTKDDLIKNVVICSLGKANPRCFVKKNADKDHKGMIFKEVAKTLSSLSYPQINNESITHLNKLKELTSDEYGEIYNEVASLVDLICESEYKLATLLDSYEYISLQKNMKEFDINWNEDEKNQQEIK